MLCPRDDRNTFKTNSGQGLPAHSALYINNNNKICSTIMAFLADCGNFKIAVARIAGGDKAGGNEYPHHVLIEVTVKGKTRRCNGAIIKENWVLTVASCLYINANK